MPLPMYLYAHLKKLTVLDIIILPQSLLVKMVKRLSFPTKKKGGTPLRTSLLKENWFGNTPMMSLMPQTWHKAYTRRKGMCLTSLPRARMRLKPLYLLLAKIRLKIQLCKHLAKKMQKLRCSRKLHVQNSRRMRSLLRDRRKPGITRRDV